jgi:hypothetical protein
MNTPKPPIDPEDMAAKFAGAQNLTDAGFAEALRNEPRLRELLWFLQWQSTQPGSLEKFSEDIIEQFPASFGPAFLHTDDPQLTPLQREEAFASLSAEWKERFIPQGPDIWKSGNVYRLPVSEDGKKNFADQLHRLDPKQIRDAFIRSAKEKLPARLRSMCDLQTEWSTPAPWYCRELLAVLFEAMDAHARAIELQIASTKLSAVVSEKLNYAWVAKKFVKFDGESRTGKTKSFQTECLMRPGRFRLVNTPPGTSLRDLYAAVAESIGVFFSPKTPIHILKGKVEFIVKHAGLCLVFDEAHFLLPPPSSAVSSPARLDWLRTNIIDRRLPCALVTTPQAFKYAVEKFKRKTSYNFDQFFGRIALTVKLPDDDREDLLGIVKIHGSEIPEQFHRRIVNDVTIFKGCASNIEDVCDRARYLAKLDAREAVTDSDIETALSEVIPGWTAPRRPTTAALRPLTAGATPVDGRNRISQPALALSPSPRQTTLTPTPI